MVAIEDPLEGGDETPVFLATLAHADGLEHLRGGPNVIVCACCRTASVDRKIGTMLSWPNGSPNSA
jgi:hypothetical protein